MYLSDVESCIEKFGAYRANGTEIKLTKRGLWAAEVKGRFMVSYSLPDLMRKAELVKMNVW